MYGQKIRTIERNKWTTRQTQKIIRVQTLESAESGRNSKGQQLKKKKTDVKI